jgi:hypothetical protein
MGFDGSHAQPFIVGGVAARWSADGSKVVFENGPPHCNASVSAGDIYIAHANGRNAQRLTSGCDAVLSPNGTKVAFENSSGDSLSVINATPGSTARDPFPAICAPGCSFPETPGWLGNNKIVYADGDSTNLFEVAAAGGKPVQLTTGGRGGGGVTFFNGTAGSPDGSRIVASGASASDVGVSIYIVRGGGGKPTEVAAAPARHNYDFPQWSPDGKSITFFDDNRSGPTTTSQVMVVSAAGGRPRVLNPGDNTAQNPSFVPTAGCASGKSHADLYRVGAATKSCPVILPHHIRNPDSPQAMNDRIPPGVNTAVTVTMPSLTKADSKITLEVVGKPGDGKALIDGHATLDIRAGGKQTIELQGTQQTSCDRGPQLRLEALQSGKVVAMSEPFAVSAIPQNWHSSFSSLVSGGQQGIEVKESYKSDSGNIGDLKCAKVAELVQLKEGKADGNTITGRYVAAIGRGYDHHGIGINLITPNFKNVFQQAHVFIDGRSKSNNIPITGSGYAISHIADAKGLRFTTCKLAKTVTVSALIPGTKAIVKASTRAGGIDPAKGICRTQDVPKAAPEFRSLASTIFDVGKRSSFTVETLGRPPARLTEKGRLPRGITFVDNGNGTATLAGTPRGPTNNYDLKLRATNGVNPAATQTFHLLVTDLKV